MPGCMFMSAEGGKTWARTTPDGSAGMRPLSVSTWRGENSSCCTLWPSRPYPPFPAARRRVNTRTSAQPHSSSASWSGCTPQQRAQQTLHTCAAAFAHGLLVAKHTYSAACIVWRLAHPR